MVSIQQFLLAFVVFGAMNSISARATGQSYEASGSKATVLAKKTSLEDTTKVIAPAWWNLHTLLTPRLFFYARPKSKSVNAESTTTKMPALTTTAYQSTSEVRVVRSSTTTKTITTQPSKVTSPVSTTSPAKKSLGNLETTPSTIKTTTHTTSEPPSTQAKSTTSRQSLSDGRRSTQLYRGSTTQPRASSEQATVDLTQPATPTTSSTTRTPTSTTTTRPVTTTSAGRTTLSPIIKAMIKPKTANKGDRIRIQRPPEDLREREDRWGSQREDSRANFERTKKRRRNRNNRRQARNQRRLMKKIRKACKLLTRRTRPKKTMDPTWIEERTKATDRLINLLRKSEKKNRHKRPKLRHHRRRKFIVDALFQMFDHSADGVIRRHEFEAFLEIVGIVAPRATMSTKVRLEVVGPER